MNWMLKNKICTEINDIINKIFLKFENLKIVNKIKV